MKIVFQNPHLTSDTWTSGIHDYAVEYLRKHRPHVRIWPPHRFWKWFLFLRKKNLPLTGWSYALTEGDLHGYDVWLSMSGNPRIQHDPPPRRFDGLKLYHVMDYSFRTAKASEAMARSRIDFLLGYARHDEWCSYFRSFYPDYRRKVIPIPFGFGKRFKMTKPFGHRDPRCSVMGAVNPVQDPVSQPDSITDYTFFFKDVPWAHPMRAAVRENLSNLGDMVVNFMAVPPATKNTAYNSVEELNNYKMFLNDDSIMHYPPARTFEGAACGAVMIRSDHPCYEDFGWIERTNCLSHRFADLENFRQTALRAMADPDQLEGLHSASLQHAAKFSHVHVADGLHEIISRLWKGASASDLAHYWRDF